MKLELKQEALIDTEQLLRLLRKRHLKRKLSCFLRLNLAFSVSFNSNVGKFLWI